MRAHSSTANLYHLTVNRKPVDPVSAIVRWGWGAINTAVILALGYFGGAEFGAPWLGLTLAILFKALLILAGATSSNKETSEAVAEGFRIKGYLVRRLKYSTGSSAIWLVVGDHAVVFAHQPVLGSILRERNARFRARLANEAADLAQRAGLNLGSISVVSIEPRTKDESPIVIDGVTVHLVTQPEFIADVFNTSPAITVEDRDALLTA